MSPRTVEQQYRLFLLVVSGLLFAGTVGELIFAEHTESVVQWIPFILCGLGLAAVIAVLRFPGRRVLRLFRLVMLVVVLGSLFGVYEHLEHNLAFTREIRPSAAGGELLWETLTGASPPLAPGTLALAAVLGVAATYRHPDLSPVPDEV